LSIHIKKSTIGGKDNANQEQNKMNLFIFYAEVQLIFAFEAKMMQIKCRTFMLAWKSHAETRLIFSKENQISAF